MQEELLCLEHLSVDYKVESGYLSAVNDVSLSIHRGEIFALVGESGCGKSTVAHNIMRLSIDHNEVVQGRVLFEGRDLLALTEAEMEKVRGKHIGFCVHLGVHRDECIVRSVAVHQKVVDAEYAVVSRDFGFQLGNELFVGCNPD